MFVPKDMEDIILSWWWISLPIGTFHWFFYVQGICADNSSFQLGEGFDWGSCRQVYRRKTYFPL